MAVTIIKDDGNDYSGKFVATSSFNEKDVVACGKNPLKVREQAIKKGHSSPVVFFVPKKNTTYIF